jgi:hypothetical protein
VHVGQCRELLEAVALVGAGNVQRAARADQPGAGKAGRRGEQEVAAGPRQRANLRTAVNLGEQRGGAAGRGDREPGWCSRSITATAWVAASCAAAEAPAMPPPTTSTS